MASLAILHTAVATYPAGLNEQQIISLKLRISAVRGSITTRPYKSSVPGVVQVTVDSALGSHVQRRCP